MERNEWEIFERTGRISDYLNYCRRKQKRTEGRSLVRQERAEEPEEKYERGALGDRHRLIYCGCRRV